MKTTFALALLLLPGLRAFAQQPNPASPLDALSYGVVLDAPGMKNVVVQADIPYRSDANGRLNLDLYLPPGLSSTETRPAIIFLNAIGDAPGQPKVKSWGIYSTWPRLMAAQGYIGISMEADGEHIPESIQGVFDFIASRGSQYHIDRDRLGVYAASANVTRSAEYLMQANAYAGVKAAVLYYGRAPAGPYRKDLPVFFVVAEADVRRQSYDSLWHEILKNNAPWTIKMGTGMPHAFDAYADNDAARIIVKETISFWKNHLDPVPKPGWPYSKGREVLATLQLDRPRATQLLQALVLEYPNDPNTLLFYANTLRENQSYAEAETYYKKVIQTQPNSSEALVKLAEVSYLLNKPADAERYMATAAQSGPLDRFWYIQLGYNLLVAGKNADAAVYYEKALAMEPRGVDYYNLACAYAKMKDKEKAFAALALAIEHGFESRSQMAGDPDLEALRSDQRYKDLLEKTK